MIEKINKITYLLSALWKRARKKAIFLRYFYTIDNVGDILNVELVEHYTNRKVLYPPLIWRFKHLLAVGSVLDQMNKNSTVLGSGLIAPEELSKINELGNIKALRGKLSKKLLEDKFNIKLDIELGDFALLFPKIFNPTIEPTFEFGVVLHYVDENHSVKKLISKMGGKVISVRQRPFNFIREIKECKNILSSSMHGLILCDAYQIPNKRLILSDKIFGGDFKFKDYYSTTDNKDESGLVMQDTVHESVLEDAIKLCSIKKYVFDLEKLEVIMKKLTL